MAHKQNAPLLARIAELSSLINRSSANKRAPTANRVYVRPAAVAAAAPVLAPATPPPAPPPQPSAARFDRKKRRYMNPVWRAAAPLSGAAAPMTPRPAPLSKKRLKARLKPAASRKLGNRVTVFREDSSFRKMKPNVLARSDSLGNKTLRVPKPKQRPVCSFFLRGECFKEDCEFLHVNVGQDAPVCEDFRNGFCELGDKCLKRHVKKEGKKEARKRVREQEEDNDEFIKL